MANDDILSEGQVADMTVASFTCHLAEIIKAISSGVDVKNNAAWSLLDTNGHLVTIKDLVLSVSILIKSPQTKLL